MLNRTKKITRKVHEKTESRDQNNFDEHFYKIGLQEDEAVDVQKANPWKLIWAAVTPFIVGFIILMITTMAMSRHPDVSIYSGKMLGSEIINMGAILSETDQKLSTKDYTVNLPIEGETTLMIVWDYAAEDGDMVSVLFDGKPMGDSFTIYHAPKTIKVPKNSKVEVIGTFDGGGGITYAVNFPEIQKTILNGLESGEQNVYSLKPVL